MSLELSKLQPPDNLQNENLDPDLFGDTPNCKNNNLLAEFASTSA